MAHLWRCCSCGRPLSSTKRLVATTEFHRALSSHQHGGSHSGLQVANRQDIARSNSSDNQDANYALARTPILQQLMGLAATGSDNAPAFRHLLRTSLKRLQRRTGESNDNELPISSGDVSELVKHLQAAHQAPLASFTTKLCRRAGIQVEVPALSSIIRNECAWSGAHAGQAYLHGLESDLGPVPPPASALAAVIDAYLREGDVPSARHLTETSGVRDNIDVKLAWLGHFVYEADVHSAEETMQRLLTLEPSQDQLSVRICHPFLRMLARKDAASAANRQRRRRHDRPHTKHLKKDSLKNDIPEHTRSHHMAAVEWLWRLEQAGVRLNETLFQAVMAPLAQQGMYDTCLKLSEAMLDRGISPTAATFSVLLYACTNTQQLNDTIMLMDKHGVEPDVVAFTTVINFYAQRGRVDKAQQWLDRMEQQAKLEPTTHTFNVMIKACVVSGDMAAATSYFHAMPSKGLQPDQTTFSTLIHGFCQVDDYERAVAWLRQMTQMGVQPSAFCINPILLKLFDDGDFVRARQLYHWSLQHNVALDELSFATMLRVVAAMQRGSGGEHDHRETAVEVFFKMLDSKTGFALDNVKELLLAALGRSRYLQLIRRHRVAIDAAEKRFSNHQR